MVEHHEASCNFELPLEQNDSAFLHYRIQDSGVWDCYHTEVPSTHRGQGLGGILAKVSHTHQPICKATPTTHIIIIIIRALCVRVL